jgi:DNA polymerase-3 subunit alpha
MEGSIEVFVFSEALERYGGALVQDAAVLLCGTVSRRNEKLNILANEIYPLKDAPRLFTRRISLHVPATHLQDDRLNRIRELLRMHPGDTPTCLCLEFPAGEKVFIEADRAYNVLVDESLVHKLEQELGERAVFVDVIKTPCRRPPNENRRRFANGNRGGSDE